MTAPTPPSRRRGWWKRWRRRWALVSVLSFWLAMLVLALPLAAHADTNTLASYGATASAWAIQPYAVNDAFLNVPIADEAAPYVFISMDNTPGAAAKAAYFFPGNGANAVFNTQGVSAPVPNGVDARYPSNNTSVSQSAGPVNDGRGDQVGGAIQSVQVSEGFAQATASEVSYQFAPSASSLPPVSVPSGVPTPPSVPGPPTQPTPTPTSGSGGGGGGPAPTPTPTPTCTPVPIINQCLPHAATGGHVRAMSTAPQPGNPPAQLPDSVEQVLTAQLRAAEAANPTLLKLAPNAQLAAPNPSLPYAGGDVSSTAVSRATDNGVGVSVATHAAKLQLFQGLITFSTVDSTLQGVAPAAKSPGSGTITTRITGAAIAGIPVTIDDQGVHVVDQGASSGQIQQLSDQLNGALTKAGVQIILTKTSTKVDTGFWEAAGGGLEVTAELNPGSGLPSPASGVPATHVDFSIGKVIASIYAVAGTSTDTGGGGFCFFCGGSGFPGFPGDNTPSSPGQQGQGPLTLPFGLSGVELLALTFVIQGVSTGAVAAAAGYADAAAKAARPPTEEESK